MKRVLITIIIVAVGSLGISISFPIGPVSLTSSPGFRSPEMHKDYGKKIGRTLAI